METAGVVSCLALALWPILRAREIDAMKRLSALALAVAAAGFASAQITMTGLTSFAGDGWLDQTEGGFSANNERGMAYNPVTGNILVMSRTGGNIVRVFNGLTGASVGNFTLNGIHTTNSTLNVNQIAVSDSGAIYVTNLQGDLTDSTKLKVYKYNSEADLATGFQSLTELKPLSNARIGDSLDVMQDGANTVLVMGYGNGTSIFDNSYALITDDGTSLTATHIGIESAPPNAGDFRLGITFGENVNSVLGTAGTILRRTTYSGETGTLLGSRNWTDVNERPMDFAIVNGFHLLATVQSNSNMVRVYDMTDVSNISLVASGNLTGSFVANGNATGQVRWGAINGDTATLYALNTNNGVQAFTVQAVPEPGTLAALGLGMVALLRRRRKA